MGRKNDGAARVSTKGQVVIPAAIRRKVGITPGGSLRVTTDDRHIYLEVDGQTTPDELAQMIAEVIRAAGNDGRISAQLLVAALVERTGKRKRAVSQLLDRHYAALASRFEFDGGAKENGVYAGGAWRKSVGLRI